MRKKGLLSGLIFILFCLPVFAEEEEISITTYYPSPFGSYNELEIRRSVNYHPVNKDDPAFWVPPPQDGELIYNVDKKFYYYNGNQTKWIALGEKTVLSVTGTPTWTESSGWPFCLMTAGGHKGSWTYNFPQPPVKILAVEVKGQVLSYCAGATTVNWRIDTNSGNIIKGRYNKDRISPGGEAVTDYSFGIGLSKSGVDMLQSVASITVTWGMDAGIPGSACWCSQFGYALPGGGSETVTVYYTPA